MKKEKKEKNCAADSLRYYVKLIESIKKNRFSEALKILKQIEKED